MSGNRRIIIGEITQSGVKGPALAEALSARLNSAQQPATAPVKQPSTQGKKK